MIEQILSIIDNSDYDFTTYAKQGDELSHLFDELRPYFRLKHAIAKALEPKKILEIGVGYGYSAKTFLDAVPNASFVCLYSNSDLLTYSQGSCKWPLDITKMHNIQHVSEDSITKSEFPGGYYDLIHINGQRDGDIIFSYLERALKQANYILVDGFWASKENMLAISYFSEKFKDFIEYIITIPSYSGEYLIKVKDNKVLFSNPDASYSDLAECYDDNYFLRDCGGYEAFKKGKGKSYFDTRHSSLIGLLDIHKDESVLDVGCGRGEMSYLAYIAGGHVKGLDYSKASIDIAKANYHVEDNRLSFIYSDFLEYTADTKFDKIVAADFVEHVEQPILENMFKKSSDLLCKNGLFLVHTAPNKNHYQEYVERRDIAKSIGSYLPENPRSYYEDLMHINEQTPDVLEESLKKYFRSVHVWTTDFPDMLGDLTGDLDDPKKSFGRSIVAIASHKVLAKNDILLLCSQYKVDSTFLDCNLNVEKYPEEVSVNEVFEIEVTLKNNSLERLSTYDPFPINFSYHWRDSSNEYVIYDGQRTSLVVPVLPGSYVTQNVIIKAPEISGTFLLEVSMVQELNFWFEEKIPDFPTSLGITVKE